MKTFNTTCVSPIFTLLASSSNSKPLFINGISFRNIQLTWYKSFYLLLIMMPDGGVLLPLLLKTVLPSHTLLHYLLNQRNQSHHLALWQPINASLLETPVFHGTIYSPDGGVGDRGVLQFIKLNWSCQRKPGLRYY